MSTADSAPRTETSRQRQERIPLDYYKHWSRLDFWKSVLTAGAIVAVLVWLLTDWLTGRGEAAFTHGPVTRPHVAWESNCEACHEPFRPINANTWMHEALQISGTANARCETCHAGPPHHANSTGNEAACGSCHHDHRGREASLVSLSDAHCTRCHANLAPHTRSGTSVYANTITHFTKDHPEFRSLLNTTRTLKFNHQLHMIPGMNSQKPLITLGDLPEADRQRYAEQQSDQRPEAPVTLTCASCHQLDPDGRDRTVAGLPRGALQPARPSSGLMLPIVFESHCKACHRLDGFDLDRRSLEAPHRVSAEQMKTFLTRTYQAEASMRPQANDSGSWVRDRVEEASRSLYNQRTYCILCHPYVKPPEGVVTSPQEFVRARIPNLWLKSARFNHVAHKAVRCAECHAGAYPPGDQPPTDVEAGPRSENAEKPETRPVLIAGLKNCQRCHAPTGKALDGSPLGGIRHGCTDCHSYHNGDAPDQGLGAILRASRHPMSLAEFLGATRRQQK